MVQHFSHSAVLRVWCVCAKRVYISVRVCASVVVMQVIQTLRASVCVCPASLHLFIGQKVRLSRRHRVCLCVFVSSLYDSVSHFSNSVISPLGTKLIKLKFLSVCVYVCVPRKEERKKREEEMFCRFLSLLFVSNMKWQICVMCVCLCASMRVCTHLCWLGSSSPLLFNHVVHLFSFSPPPSPSMSFYHHHFQPGGRTLKKRSQLEVVVRARSE